MEFKLQEAIEILERTPDTLICFLSGLSNEWLLANEGAGTWNAEEVVGHLIEAEKTNWLLRVETILQKGENELFPPFDRFAHSKNQSSNSIEEKLHEFKTIRMQNIEKLKEIIDSGTPFELTGMHPEFGPVKLRELLSTWVVHDMTHISQIVRVMAERYREDVGPWANYLGVLKRK
ncbi:DinB family protein [Planococcus shenhongbingii]|uniref:DinB family protein n=1 Tax=Planococcus shenhongbingii TaxID=3058398 RepID=A0ABT8NF04_9BACL|nr:DinB family protein [Planococcus sp. N017]MDN7246466.1 DinB family protein [Planococcus sp. N017]